MGGEGDTNGTDWDGPGYLVSWIAIGNAAAIMGILYALAPQRGTFGHPIGMMADLLRMSVLVIVWVCLGIDFGRSRTLFPIRNAWLRWALAIVAAGVSAVVVLVVLEIVCWKILIWIGPVFFSR
ncbi:MAG: hypothetical protein JJU33_00890 [Phycisphaerales bacterium]|nr:hypothetical protein [Phycisphaerales bacterium]